ncbi:MAG: serine/threonine protein kinase [Planctomycetia bacterium]|nr:serine/threonine protein kinase [Planctomycetia bacterium]
MPPPPNDPSKPSEAEGVPNLTETYLPSQDAPPPSFPSSPSKSLSLPPELLTLTQYEILKELGAGGMGLVYLAKDIPLNRNVVIKVIKTERLHRSSAIERFTREMQAAARLNHTNVVTAYTSHQIGEFLVFVMEYVPGDDLSKLVKTSGKLAVTNAAYYIHQVARGLQHAHENGLVHRDIKPSNLILNKNGKKHTVKILDFGLAKARSEDEEINTGLTGMGKMLGTPEYVAPEQIRDASSADIRADLYSLGCTLYYLLAGEPPFRGRSEFELQEAHVFKTAKPLNLVRPEVPVELANIVGKMMAKEPGKRYQTPAEVVVALTPFLKGGTAPTGTGPQPIILLEEDNERSGEIKPGTGSTRPLGVPVAKAIPAPATSMPSKTAVPVARPAERKDLPDLGKAEAIPAVAPDKSRSTDKSSPGEPSTAAAPGADTKANSDDQRARTTRVDDGDDDRPVRRRRREPQPRKPVNLSKVVWWLIWGYSQLVFLLLVAGIAAEFHGDAKSSSENSTTKTASTKSSSDVSSKSSTSHPSFFLLELPAIVALFAIVIGLTRATPPTPTEAPPKAPVTRWSRRNWWIASFLLSWLLGLSSSVLFVDTRILMVVAFLVVLGVGAGIAVFLSRSAAAESGEDDDPPAPPEANP